MYKNVLILFLGRNIEWIARSVPSDKEEDAGGLTPAEDDDEAWREQTRKTLMNSIKEEYESGMSIPERKYVISKNSICQN